MEASGPGSLGERAARGVGVLVGRTLTLQLLTAGVTVALARILTPADYGLFALAQAAQLVTWKLAELGIGGALLRRREEPSPAEQRAAVTLSVVLAVVLVGLIFGLAFLLLPLSGLDEEGAQVVAVCALAAPIYALRTLPMVLLERRLSFGRVALVETGETLAFNAFALLAAIAGLGAFSLAAAVPAAALAGTMIAWRLQPFARGFTRHLAPVRPLIRFGIGLSGLQIANVLQSLAFVSVLTAAGGASLAGFYAMAQRLFAFPIALTAALSRVSFPALSRGEVSERPRRAARAAVLGAVVVGLPLAVVAGAADPLIDVLLGERWLPTADLVLTAAAGMMLITAAAVPMVSLALAEGRTGLPLAATLAQSAVLLGGAALLPGLSAGEAGAVIAVAAVVEVVILAARTEPVMRRALARVGVAFAIAAAAGATARLLGPGSGVGSLVLGVAAAAAVWGGLSLALMRPALWELWQLARPVLARLRPGASPPVRSS